MRKIEISPLLVRDLIDYDKESGLFTWKKRRLDLFGSEQSGKTWNKRFAGKPALTADCQGYKFGHLLGVRIYAHQVAWAHVHGAWPPASIDHINGHKSDNRISNLRSVSPSDNARNTKLHSRNKSGVSGVDKSRGRWRARISVDGKAVNLGKFECFGRAVVARKLAERRFGYHQNHGRGC